MPLCIMEIGTEELPARFLPVLAEEIKRLAAEELIAAKIDYALAFSHATPRRLVLRLVEVAETQRSEEVIVTGPPAAVAYDADGNPTKAALGFARGQGVEPADLFSHETDKGAYVAVKKTEGGGRVAELLPAIFQRMVKKLSFPKRMTWGAGKFAFGRPVRWFTAFLGDEFIPFTVEELSAEPVTRGHRVLGPGPFAVASAEDYFTVMAEKCRVVLKYDSRVETILKQGQALCAEKGGELIGNDRLLSEVANLVEHPVPVLGRFDKRYLELPREVLLTSMEKHQKSFGVQDAEGRLLPHFLTVLNIAPTDIGLVQKGWERVLKARLEDARFFFRTDMASDFDTWLAKLDHVTFLAALGSMGAKAARLEKLCSHLADILSPEDKIEFAQAGRLAKCDLVTEMVGEFDELQGVMGGIYARAKGEAEYVARGIAEHYLPTGPDSRTPESLAGAVVSMADKADTLAGCFGLSMAPTGGADPYALRRAALGIIRIVLKHKLRLSLGDLLARAFDGYVDVEWKVPREQVLADLYEFFAQRLRAHFTAQGYETLVVDACLGAGFDDLWAFGARLEALSGFSRSADFEQSVLTFKRAANIIRKQGDEAGRELTGKYDPELFDNNYERALASAVTEVAPRFERSWAADDYGSLLMLLYELRPVVDEFFDNVMVMTENEEVRANRLNLLKSLVDMLGRLADFNALQV